MSVSEKINRFIKECGGIERDAINIALCKIEELKIETERLKTEKDHLEEELEALKRATNYKLAEQEYKLFIGTETGIEDIDKAPDEPDYDNQAKDYDEDQRWEGSPTEYDM